MPRDFRGNEDRFDYKPATLEMLVSALLEQGAEVSYTFPLGTRPPFEEVTHITLRKWVGIPDGGAEPTPDDVEQLWKELHPDSERHP